MYDAGLYPAQAIRQLQAHWQRTKGVSDFGRMLKGAGRRAGAKRSPEARSRIGQKGVGDDAPAPTVTVSCLRYDMPGTRGPGHWE